MKLIKYVWLGSLIAGILLFIDDIAGVDTEDVNGVVTANSGKISGSLSWPLLGIAAAVFIAASIILIYKTKRK